jgi:DNA-binding response OmpR family regulator
MAAELPPREVVLVIDDTPETLRFLTDTIDRAGMTVLIATSGEAAIELLDHITPSLILMDAVMPGMGGFEATRTIKRNSAWAHIPVIFMTGLTESEHVVNALESGGVDYVRKPIVVEELLARVRVHLANAKIAHGGQIALDATGRHLLAVDADGGLLWCTPHSEQLLADLDPAWSKEDGTVPAIVGGAIARLVASDVASGGSVKIELPGSTLEILLVARWKRDEILVRLNMIGQSADIERLQARYNLTPREAEVLLWISNGKPNRVISEILGISPRTVNKHLEHLFEKLGVETRAAAAAFAVRTTSR